MKLKQLIAESVKTVSRCYPEEEAREMVFAYLEYAFGTKKYTHIIDPGYEIPEDGVAQARQAFARMASGEPLQYVTGEAYFYGRRFNVTPAVLIPRPETEILCQSVLNESGAGKGSKILDLCTGSGCIAWTLALELPGAEATAVDISEDALGVASGQDFSEEISRTEAHKPHFIKADVLAAPMAELGQFDVLTSNPPYVMESEKALMRRNVLEHEPELALFVTDEDPLIFYRAVASWAVGLLKPGGFGIVEINEALGAETAGVFADAGMTDVNILKDLSGKDRFVSFRKQIPTDAT